MTTVKDVLLAALRDMGADGVTVGYGTAPLSEIESGEFWAAANARPAFRDADGDLVPLPDGWQLSYTTDSHATYENVAGAIVKFWSRGLWTASPSVGIVHQCATAHEAFAAAERHGGCQ